LLLREVLLHKHVAITKGVEYVVDDRREDVAEAIGDWLFQFLQNVLPVFSQKQVHVVGECLVAIEESRKVD